MCGNFRKDFVHIGEYFRKTSCLCFRGVGCEDNFRHVALGDKGELFGDGLQMMVDGLAQKDNHRLLLSADDLELFIFVGALRGVAEGKKNAQSDCEGRSEERDGRVFAACGKQGAASIRSRSHGE